jgi:hypothetical protein
MSWFIIIITRTFICEIGFFGCYSLFIVLAVENTTIDEILP